MSETVIDNLIIEISTDSSKAGSNIDIVTAALNRLKGSSSSLSKATAGLSGLNKAIKGIASSKIASALGSAVKNVNSYVENVNLFTVSMGKYADEAFRYAQRVQDAMGVDSSEFIRNQAIFMQMAEGFGVAEKEAYQLSKGLTELAYDISSFYNTDMETAFQRLQSGVAGEIEPVRRWGIALDQASMKQWLMKKGIDANVNSLTQADKALVRYNMMVETLSNNGAVGDLARTLETPANAIRILQQQITQLSRAIGSLFIPVLVKVIPYIQAFVKVATEAAQALANLLGINISFDVDYSGLNAGVSGVADAYDDAAKSAKKLKDYTMGFDELNIINPNTGSAASGTAAGIQGLGLEAMSVWDESIFDGINNKVDELTGKMKVLLGVVVAVGVAFEAWKIGSVIVGGLQSIIGVAQALRLAFAGFPNLASKLFPGNSMSKVFNAFSTLGAMTAKQKLLFGGLVTVTALVVAALIDLWKNSETFRDTVKSVIDEVKAAFVGLKDAVWEKVVVPIMDALGIAATSFEDLYARYIRPIVEKIATALVVGLGGAVVGVIDLFSLAVTLIGAAVEGIALLISTFATNAVTNITTMKDQFKSLWEQIRRNTVDKVTELKTWLDNTWDKVIQGFERLKEGIRSRIDSIKGFFGGLIDTINSAIRAIEDFLTIDIGNTSIGIDLPEIGKRDGFGLKVEKYATGGFLEDGLFTMNHGEIAGKFSNGKSVVANNQQIVDGIADGVYRAIMMAQNEESERPLQVNVYLDGKQVSKSVNKYNSSKGVSIMGNSLGYNF